MRKQPPRWPLFAWLGLAALLGGLIGFTSVSLTFERGELFGESAPHARLAPAVHISLAPTVGMSPEQTCRMKGTGCARMLLAAINADRQQHGAPPLTLDWTQTHGTASCIGSVGHSRHMAQTGQLLHDQFPSDLCGSFRTAGENIAEAGGNKADAILTGLQLMLSEPWSPGCTSNHACNLRSTSFSRIGLGFAFGHGAWFQTQDLTG